jgi:hypothetical protein
VIQQAESYVQEGFRPLECMTGRAAKTGGAASDAREVGAVDGGIPSPEAAEAPVVGVGAGVATWAWTRVAGVPGQWRHRYGTTGRQGCWRMGLCREIRWGSEAFFISTA